MSDQTYTQTYREPLIPCIICHLPLTMRTAQGRKSGKTFIMLLCGKNARHFRAFINDKDFVERVIARARTVESNGSTGTGTSR